MNYHSIFHCFKNDLRQLYLQRFIRPHVHYLFSPKCSALLYTANIVIASAKISRGIANAKCQFNQHQSAKGDIPHRYDMIYQNEISKAHCLFLPFVAMNSIGGPREFKIDNVFADLEVPISDCVSSRRYQDATTFYSWCAKYICTRLKANHFRSRGGSVVADIKDLAYHPASKGYYPCWKGYSVLLPKIDK